MFRAGVPYCPPRAARSGRALVAATLATAAALASSTVGTPAQGATSLAVIAHRGDAAARPESTSTAFRSAIAKGAKYIEMDVRFTSSKYPVILHDATLDRTTNCSGQVTHYTRTALAKCDAGSWFSATYRGERVPTLNTALSTISNASGTTKVLLHVKQLPDATMASRIESSIDTYGMRSRIIIIADTASILNRMKPRHPTELGLVLGSSAGWVQTWKYMIPYDTSVSSTQAATVHKRGGKVWPVETSSVSLRSLLAKSYIDGLLVNHLSTALDLIFPPPPPTPKPTPTPTPTPVVPTPTPTPVVPMPTPTPVVPTPTPEPVVPTPTPEPVAPTPTPEPVAPTPTPEPVAPTPTPEPVAPTPTPTPEPPPVP